MEGCSTGMNVQCIYDGASTVPETATVWWARQIRAQWHQEQLKMTVSQRTRFIIFLLGPERLKQVRTLSKALHLQLEEFSFVSKVFCCVPRFVGTATIVYRLRVRFFIAFALSKLCLNVLVHINSLFAAIHCTTVHFRLERRLQVQVSISATCLCALKAQQ